MTTNVSWKELGVLIALFTLLAVVSIIQINGRSMNTLAQDRAFMESYRILEMQEMQSHLERYDEKGGER